VELQPICFFDSEKNWREPDLWTPYLYVDNMDLLHININMDVVELFDEVHIAIQSAIG
jgi:hypothetical protein